MNLKEQIKEQIDHNGFFVNKYLFTTISIKKKDNEFMIDHKWRISGLLFSVLLFLFTWILIILVFHPNFINVLSLFREVDYVQDYKMSEFINNWSIQLSLIIPILFGFSIAKTLDGSSKQKHDLEVEVRLLKLEYLIIEKKK
jgi:hypothetical protein